MVNSSTCRHDITRMVQRLDLHIICQLVLYVILACPAGTYGLADAIVYTSVPSNMTLFNGDPIDLEWSTSFSRDVISWCYWQFAIVREGVPTKDQFIGYFYDENRRLNISSKHEGWFFTKPESPCEGGIWRNTTSPSNTGAYSMRIELRNSSVYDSSDSHVFVSECSQPPDIKEMPHSVAMETDHVVVTYTCPATFTNLFTGQAVSYNCSHETKDWQSVSGREAPAECDEVTTEFIIVVASVGVLVVLIVIVVCVVCCKKKRHRKNKNLRVNADTEMAPLNEGPLEFKKAFGKVIIPVGKDSYLRVKLSKEARVTWSRDDQPVVKNKKGYKLSKDKAQLEHHLLLKDVTPDMAGTYKCTASSHGEQNETSNRVVVKTADMSPPSFSKALLGVTKVELNKQSVHEVQVQGNPEPSVKCVYKGAEVTDGANGLVTISKRNSREKSLSVVDVTLTFNPTTLEDCGDLHLEATNDLKTDKIESRIEVTSKPIVVEKLHSVTKSEGETEFVAAVKSYPLAEVAWYFNGEPITRHKPRTEEIVDNFQTRSHLSIPSITSKDFGSYKLVATNIYGQADTTTNLSKPITENFIEKVKNLPSALIDMLKETDTAQFVVEENVTFFMKFNKAIPKDDTIKWLKDDKELLFTERHELEPLDEKTYSLTITKCCNGDEGKYKAAAVSTGETCSVRLSSANPVSPKVQEQLKAKLEVDANSTAKFETVMTGLPPPTIKWYRDGKEMKSGESPRIIIISVTEKNVTRSSLTIEPCTMGEDDIKISARGSNQKGNIETSSHLEVMIC